MSDTDGPIDFDGVATVMAVTPEATLIVPADTVLGGGGFWLTAGMLPVCGELHGLVIAGTITMPADPQDGGLWVDVQVVGQAHKAAVVWADGHWEAAGLDGRVVQIPVPAGVSRSDAERAGGAEFWLFEGDIPGVEFPGQFADLRAALAG